LGSILSPQKFECFLKNKILKNHDVWHKDYLLAFTRGQVFIVLSNNGQKVEEDVTGMPFPAGTKLCDALTDHKECIIVAGGKVHLSLKPNQSRIYVKS